MAIEKKDATEIAELRGRAEKRLCAQTPKLHSPQTEGETQRLLHQLEVHQVELEMQNAELRQARDELERALAMCADLYDFAPVGYFTIDRDGVTLDVNLTGASLLGIERSGLIGRRFELLVANEDRQFFPEFLRKVFASQDKEACEVALKKEGERLLHLQIEAVASASAAACRIAAIDITERRRAEEAVTQKRRELAEINHTLEMRIAQNVDELHRKDQHLIMQGRNVAMVEMINNIAHQWRQPLNALGLLIQQVPFLYDEGKFSREFLEENTCNAMHLIHHMSRIIDDFRNFFRCDKEKSAFSAYQVIRQTISLIEESFKTKQISIAFHAESEPMINSYPNEYAQVLLHILMNARDALVERNVDSPQISLHTFAEDGKTTVTITDNAGGIAEDIMGKLFDPYFTTKGPDKGTGIGLFMSKTIIEKHMGGRLTVRNTGSGAEFRIEV
jgi:PAS domain S-box-containing protein